MLACTSRCTLFSSSHRACAAAALLGPAVMLARPGAALADHRRWGVAIVASQACMIASYEGNVTMSTNEKHIIL